MKSVWVIEDGSYSDYHVVGVYDSKEKAERVRAAVGGEVAEWPLNPSYDHICAGLVPFDVVMLRDGTTERVDPREVCQYNIWADGRAFVWRRTQAPAYRGTGIPDALNATVWARDAKHAVKSANEIRARMIADGTWDAEGEGP